MKLTDNDIFIAARELACRPAHIRAVLEVEARGSGFDGDGRPVILPEPHIFYRMLTNAAQRARAVYMGLAAPRWGQIPYDKTADARWARLGKMQEINYSAAVCAASWGLGQVMGFNHSAAGFIDLGEFVSAMHRSEGDQLMAMVRFIGSQGLADELRRCDWQGFARGYNGSGYRKNKYDEKLAAAYRKHGGGGDVGQALPLGFEPILRLGDEGDAVTALQQALNRRGAAIRVDGDFGPATKRALVVVQRELGLLPDGIYGPNTKAALEEAGHLNAT